MYFYLDTPDKKTSAIKIRYYVKFEKKSFVYSTGISIHPKNWNKKNRMPIVKSGSAGFELKKITARLNLYIEQLHKTINDIQLNKENVTRSKLKQALDDSFKLSKVSIDKSSVSSMMSYYIKQREKLNKYSRQGIDKYKYLKNKLEHYNKNLKTSDINEEFMIDFINFLREHYKLTDITLNRTIGFLKTFLKWSIEYGVEIDNSYKKVTITSRDADHIHLTKEQVKVLESLELETKLDRIRDLFLIGVYSGQRFSDYTVFKKSDVIDNRIVKRAQKTNFKSYVPISKKLKKLLDKYEWRLPKVSNQKFNAYIKEVCKIAAFNDEITRTKYRGKEKIIEIQPFYERVSSHTARRTFITLASYTVPDHIIMGITGIRSANTLKTYKKFDPNLLENYVETIFQ